MRADLYLWAKVAKAHVVKRIENIAKYKTNLVRQTAYRNASSLLLHCPCQWQWTTHDTAAIELRFGSRPKISKKKDIIHLFGEDQGLSNILICKGSLQCYKKVQTFNKCTGMWLPLVISADLYCVCYVWSAKDDTMDCISRPL